MVYLLRVRLTVAKIIGATTNLYCIDKKVHFELLGWVTNFYDGIQVYMGIFCCHMCHIECCWGYSSWDVGQRDSGLDIYY